MLRMSMSSLRRVPATGRAARAERGFALRARAGDADAEDGAAAAPRLTTAEEVRTLVARHKFGVVSANSSDARTAGFPSSAVVPFAVDDRGAVICCLSDLSALKRDLKEDPRASLVVSNAGFASMADARCAVTGRLEAVAVEGDDASACRDLFQGAHPDAFWSDFGDFSYLRMSDVVEARLVGGFGRIGRVSGAEYAEAGVDPVARFSAPVCAHMNSDHSDACIAIASQVTGQAVEKVELLSIDRYGINAQCAMDGALVSVRLPFSEPALDRGAVKERIVAMSRQAAAAQKQALEAVPAV